MNLKLVLSTEPLFGPEIFFFRFILGWDILVMSDLILPFNKKKRLHGWAWYKLLKFYIATTISYKIN